MTMQTFQLRARLMALLAVACLFAALPAAHAATKASKKAAEAKPVGEVVQYESLEGRVGQQIVIETTLKTVRRGTLTKYTQPVLTLQLGPESGSIELSVPRETIKTITVFAPAAPTDNQGKSGAKEN
ncbi:MAG: hypothetical protein ACREPX_12245 [Rhodanobacteraceae bacterium]